MKTKRFILTVLTAITGTCLAMGATNEVSTLLQKGLFEEEANRNLDAAIQAYQSVITQTDKDRQFAATAIFRLGECYRKLGKTNEANEQYRRILREFPEQAELAKLSRQYVGSDEAAAPASNPEGAPTLQNRIAAAQAEINTHERELKELTNRKTARVFALQHFPNPVLTSLMQDAVKTEQELAGLKNDLGDKHPDVTRAQATLQTINEQVDAQIRGIKADAEAKLSEAQATLSDLKKHASEAPKELAASGTQEQPPTKSSQEDEKIKQLQAMLHDSPDLINANDSFGHTPFGSAVRNGQLRVVQFLLNNNANLAAYDGTGQTPLLIAVQAEQRDIVELLLNRGADVNAVSEPRSLTDQRFFLGYTPLHYAAESGNKAIAELLLAHGAKVNAQDASGESPLMAAVKRGFKSVAEMLIARGADVNVRNNDGKSALILATEKNRPSIVELLLASKADVNLASNGGLTPLISAVNASQPDTVKLLLEHGADARAKMADDNPSTPRWTALDAAVVMNDNASLKLLLENHADPNATFDLSDRGNVYERNSTPLILAAEHKHADSAAILLAHGADVNARNASGWTPLFEAMLSKNDGTTAELLLKNKADTEILYDIGNPGKRTLLQYAASQGKRELAELLLAHGANVNAQNDDGQTALHLAAKADSRTIVELLLSHGADVNLKDKQGHTALDLAEGSHNTGYGSNLYAPTMGGSFTIPQRPIMTPGGTAPISYQWVNNGGASGGQETTNSIAALLRQHGGLAEADISTIRVTRQGMDSATIVFKQGGNSHNHFTMFDLILAVYAPPDWNSFRLSMGHESEVPGLRFPDFSRIKIHRLEHDGHERTLKVDVQAAFAAGDCEKDVPLQWGDVVEIPESDHKINARWDGLDQTARAMLKKCLQSKVNIIVNGQTNEVTLLVDVPLSINGSLKSSRERYWPSPGSSDPSAKPELWSFWLNDVVHQANVILYSSDLTRVNVKRANPQTHKTEEMVFNLEKNSSANDLWLRDGDVIEIPEKQ